MTPTPKYLLFLHLGLNLLPMTLFFSATLVRPPAVTLIPSGETNTNGRKSTCLGARPDLVKMGTVDKDNVG